MTRKKIVAFFLSALVATLLLASGIAAAADDGAQTATEEKEITFLGASSWVYENDLSYYCEFSFAENAFMEGAKPIEWHCAEENSKYEYLQEYVSVSLDDGEWQTVKSLNDAADEADYDGGYPFTIARKPVVPFFHQAGKVMRLYFHKNFAADATIVRVRLEKGMYTEVQEGESSIKYILNETTVCEHSAAGWEVQYDSRQESLGLTAVRDWADSNGEFKVFNAYLSRPVLKLSDGNNVGYKISDAPDTQFWKLQEKIELNGKTMAEINRTVDTSEWSFTDFPFTIRSGDDWHKYDGVHYTYRVPILIYSSSANRMQVRVHNKYLETLQGNVAFTFAAGFSVTQLQTKADGSGRENVEYIFDKDITVTLRGGEWESSDAWVPYEEPEEIVIRKDIDFDAIEYEPLSLQSISPIVEYGNWQMNDGLRVRDQYFSVYFDKPICNQYIPYASHKKSSLEAKIGGDVSLTQAQVDSLFDYRIDISLNEHIKIDGLTVAERKKLELEGGESAVRIDLSGVSASTNSLTVYLGGSSLSRLDPYTAHTFEVTAGFRTPLFGEMRQSMIYYYDPISKTWSETNYAATEDWDYIDPRPQTSAEPKKKGCSSVAGASGGAAAVAAVILAAAIVAAVVRKKETIQ